MNRDWQKDLEVSSSKAVAILPPATLGETGWDILLALHSDQRRELSLEKLASLVSAQRSVMGHWLSQLEDRRLIAGAIDKFTGELRAILTVSGRELLDRYLSAASDLQTRTHH